MPIIKPTGARMTTLQSRRTERIYALFLNPAAFGNTGLESPVNRQAGKPALRRADILVCRFWGLSSPQLQEQRVNALRRTERGIYSASPCNFTRALESQMSSVVRPVKRRERRAPGGWSASL